MVEKTLREVCKITKVSRRAIQGYENAGLMSAVGKNDRGYLLYDDNSIEIIKRIKLFQDMGFSIKEIQVLNNSSNEALKEALKKRIDVLKVKGKRIEDLIRVAQNIIDNL